MRRRVFLAAGCSIVAGCLAACGPQGEASRADAPRPVKTFTVGEPSAGWELVYSGTLAAHTYVNVAFEIPGRILRRHVSVGQTVQEGTLLAELDPVLYLDQVRAASAEVRNARALVEQCQAADRRARRLLAANALAAQHAEAARRNLLGARAQLDAALSNEHRASEQLNRTAVRASRRGQVVSRFMEAGEVAAAGQPVYRLALEDGRDALFDVPEMDLPQFAVGTRLSVCPLGRSAGCTQARVEEIAPQTSEATRTFRIRAHLAGEPSMRLGATIECRVRSGGAALWRIPASALVRTADGLDAAWVLDRQKGAVDLVPIVVQEHAQESVLVKEGLAAGMTIVTAGVHVLRQGQRVREIAHAEP